MTHAISFPYVKFRHFPLDFLDSSFNIQLIFILFLVPSFSLPGLMGVLKFLILQVLEYDTPEELLSNEGSSFSKMVQSTGAANAQYLRSLVLGGEAENKLREENKQIDGQRRWLASSRWAAAAQYALAVSLTSSHNDLQRLEVEDQNNILKKTKDAVVTLQGVLERKHDKEIEESLNQHEVSTDGWWSALYRMIEGTYLKVPSALHISKWNLLFLHVDAHP